MSKRKSAYEVATQPWSYLGDVNLEHGGVYCKLDPSDLKYGYANCVEVTDLDSACGANGMCLIEVGTVNFDYKRIRKAAAACGWLTPGHRVARPHRRAALIEAVKSYYGMEVDRSEVVQTDPTFPMVNDGWKAEKVVSHIDLPGYVASNYLD
jgi:hypothetical protein